MADDTQTTAEPTQGEETGLQAASARQFTWNGRQGGIAVGDATQGYTEQPKSTYPVYRNIIAHPTVALARAAIQFPILCGNWLVKSDDDAPKGAVDGVTKRFVKMRPTFLEDALRSADNGWAPFETVWDMDASEWYPCKLKPLLVDITTCIAGKGGAFAGLKNGDDVELEPVQCLVITHDGEAGNWYGRSRCENLKKVWTNYEQTDNWSGGLIQKVAAVIPLIHYPPEKQRDAAGREITAYEAASQIIAALTKARGVAIPNLYSTTNDPVAAAALAGKAKWVISFLESTSAASNLAAITDRLGYADKLLCRGWLCPERSVIEAQTAGARADSLTAASLSLLGSMIFERQICRQLSWYLVDDYLALNYGEDARGTVWIEPAPLTDEAQAASMSIFNAVLLDPGLREEMVMQADWEQIADALALPVKPGKDITFTPTVDPAAAPGEDAVMGSPDVQSALAAHASGQMDHGTLTSLVAAKGIPMDRAGAAIASRMPTAGKPTAPAVKPSVTTTA